LGRIFVLASLELSRSIKFRRINEGISLVSSLQRQIHGSLQVKLSVIKEKNSEIQKIPLDMDILCFNLSCVVNTYLNHWTKQIVRTHLIT